MGRPTKKFTDPETGDEVEWTVPFLILLTTCPSDFVAAERLGIHYQTVQARKREDALFAEAVEEAKRMATERIEQVLYDKAFVERHFPSARFWLEAHLPLLYRENKALKVIGDKDSPLGFVVVPQQENVDEWGGVIESPNE